MAEPCRAAVEEVAVDVRSAFDQSVQLASLRASPAQAVADLMLMLEECTGVPVQYQTLLLERPSVGPITLEGHERVSDVFGAAGGTLSLVQRAPKDAEAEWREAWHIWPNASEKEALSREAATAWPTPRGPALEAWEQASRTKYAPSAALVRYLLRFVEPDLPVQAYSHDDYVCTYYYKGSALAVALRYCSLEACAELIWDSRTEADGAHAFLVDCGCYGDVPCARVDLVELCERFGREDVCRLLRESGLLSPQRTQRAQAMCERRELEERVTAAWCDDLEPAWVPLLSGDSAEDAEMLEERAQLVQWKEMRSKKSKRIRCLPDKVQKSLGRSREKALKTERQEKFAQAAGMREQTHLC